MAAPTLAILRALIDDIVSDDEITDGEIDSSINEAILSVRGDMLVTLTMSSPAAGASVAVPANFVYVYMVHLGTEDVPLYAWHLADGTAPLLVFHAAYFAGAPSGTLNITGGGVQEVLSADGDSLNIDPGHITARALASLHASRGGTASDLSDWHKSEHSKWAAIAEARLPIGLSLYGPPAGARLIKGKLTA